MEQEPGTCSFGERILVKLFLCLADKCFQCLRGELIVCVGDMSLKKKNPVKEEGAREFGVLSQEIGQMVTFRYKLR